MISIKRFFYYFVWTIAIGLVCYLGIRIRFHLEDTAVIEFNYTPIVIFTVIFPIIIGLLLRLPQFINEVKENQALTFDWVKFIAVALPTLFIIIMFILSHSNTGSTINFLLIGGSTLTTIAGIVLGYTLLDSIKSKTESK